MSTISSAPAPAQAMAGQSLARGLGATLHRWWVAYMTRRIERAAIAHLMAMSERELKDIGISRAEIGFAVMGARARDRAFNRYC